MKYILTLVSTVCLVAFLLTGCMQSTQAPITGVSSANHPKPTPVTIPGAILYTVVPGDSLGGIASRYHMSYQELAAMNHINPPYNIMIGQTLQIVTSQQLNKVAVATQSGEYGGNTAPLLVSASLPAQNLNYPTNPNGETTGKVYLPKQAVPPSGASTNTSASQLATQLVNDSTVSSKGMPLKSKVNASVASILSVTPSGVVTVGGDQWSWPLTGTVAQKFGEGTGLFGKGVQLSAPAGTPVLASSDGQVLYSGVGAAEYQQMVIVKQNNNFLTAYTNLSQISVKQAQNVTRGQQIGVIGTINGQSMLHFEVRKFGTPVNPIYYMPKSNGQ